MQQYVLKRGSFKMLESVFSLDVLINENENKILICGRLDFIYSLWKAASPCQSEKGSFPQYTCI